MFLELFKSPFTYIVLILIAVLLGILLCCICRFRRYWIKALSCRKNEDTEEEEIFERKSGYNLMANKPKEGHGSDVHINIPYSAPENREFRYIDSMES